MVWAAAAVALIEKRFHVAGIWMAVAAFLSALGIIHSYQMVGGNVANHFGFWTSPQFSCAYLIVAVVFFAFGHWLQTNPQESSGPLE